MGSLSVSDTRLPLNTGASIPALGLGTWQSAPGEVKKAVSYAIQNGYKHVDCAYCYGNEDEVGEGLKEAFDSGIKREDIFITTKLWCTYHSRVEENLDLSLKSLGVDYVDLYLMHWPCPMNPKGNDPKFPKLPDGSRDLDKTWSHIQTWLEMEKLLKTGKVKAIGVSNYSVRYLEELLPKATVIPAVNQIENHPSLPQQEIADFCKEKGIHITAYSPLGSSGSPMFRAEPVVEIAKKRSVTPAAVLLSYHLARGSSVLAKSVNPERIQTNLESLVNLDESDMSVLNNYSAQLQKEGKLMRYVYPAFGVDFGFPDKSSRGKGTNLAYAPTLEPLGRSAWCGRVGETYGADSYLNGAMGGQFVKGVASAGVIPSSKHFIMNEQETNRDTSSSGGGGGGFPSGGSFPSNSSTISARQSTNSTTSNSTTSSDDLGSYSVAIGGKAFHETYLAPFYDAVKNGVAGTMCAMNKVNGTYYESQDLLGKYLKIKLGLPGFVHADVGAQHSGINSANAGMDYGASSDWSNDTLGVGLTNGSFTTARLDDMVIRNMMGYFRYNQDEGYPTKAGVTDHVDVRGNHSTLARTYAANSIVLLKNTNSALPLKNKTSISIFGTHAAPRYVGANTALTVYVGVGPIMPGHMSTVGGSAMGTLVYVTTPFQKFVERAATDGFMSRWWLNDTSTTTSSGMSGSGSELTESTTGDELVNTVADNCNNTIVIINTTGPRLVDQWTNHPNITGVIYGGPLGQESGNALDNVLFGAVNPSGNLIHTIAKNETDYDSNTQITESLSLDYSEGNYIDYKYFDKYNITPRFEFGYGLSYTTFNYSSQVTVSGNTTALSQAYASGALAIGGREDLWDVVATVSGSVSKTGSIAGAEVTQLYVQFPDAADEPVRQLRGFLKVGIQPGESEAVSFELKRRDLSAWDVGAQSWKIESGDYVFYLGTSSRDLKAQATLTV